MTVYRGEYRSTVRRTGLEENRNGESHRMVLDRMRGHKVQQRQQQNQEEKT